MGNAGENTFRKAFTVKREAELYRNRHTQICRIKVLKEPDRVINLPKYRLFMLSELL